MAQGVSTKDIFLDYYALPIRGKHLLNYFG